MHAVISDMTKNQKIGTGHENMKPKVSMEEPNNDILSIFKAAF